MGRSAREERLPPAEGATWEEIYPALRGGGRGGISDRHLRMRSGVVIAVERIRSGAIEHIYKEGGAMSASLQKGVGL